MIEKIDKIRDLLIVPSVDEQPKMAINQMKILNLLVELRAEAEQLTIPDVVGRSELLKAFVEWQIQGNTPYAGMLIDEHIRGYFKSL